MVALSTSAVAARTRAIAPWLAAALLTIAVGAALRLALGGGGAGARSAAVLLVLLGLGALIGGRLLGSPRTGFAAAVAVAALFNLAALPPRLVPEYDDRTALYRTDQSVSISLPAAPPSSSSPMLTLLVEPSRANPSFTLSGTVGGTQLAWRCDFAAGLQRVALPVPAGTGVVDVTIRLSGEPKPESDYLLVYWSSVRGGVVADIVDAARLEPNTTRCVSAA